jgi:hypothetical protein
MPEEISLSELEIQFPYDPETDTTNQKLPDPIVLTGDVIEIAEWNVFSVRSKILGYKSLHFVGKINVNNQIMDYYSGPVKTYDPKNDWWIQDEQFVCPGCKRIYYRLVGLRNIHSMINKNIMPNMDNVDITLEENFYVYKKTEDSPVYL